MTERFVAAWSLDRPVLPAPHQIVAALWATTVEMPVSSPRSLVFHGWITLSSTLLGFALGAVLGMALAIGIVHVRTLERSLMPWLIASQTIPILAIAPIVVVALGAVGITGLVPKALISMYLSFFPVAIGMVKGLTSPEPMLLDLIRTYSAGRVQTLLQAAAAGGAALSVRLAEDRGRDQPGRRHRRRIADRQLARARGAPAHRAPITARPSRSGRRCSRPRSWRLAWSQAVALAERLTARAMGARP